MKAVARVRCALFAAAAFLVVVFAAVGFAQEPAEHYFTFNVGTGFTPMVGRISTSLNNGYNVGIGAGYRFSSHFELNGQFGWHGLGVNSGLIAEAGARGADAHIWSVTADPMIRLGGARRFDPYFVGGVGYYRRVVNFTAPSIVPTLFFDPFFGGIFPGFVPARTILSTISQSGIGGSLGFGFHIRVSESGLKIFVESRYHYAATGSVPTRMIPLTIGFRW